MKYIGALVIVLSNLLFINTDKEYVKDYEKGMLTSEGWVVNGEKDGYWKFYNAGEISAQGHFKSGEKDGYWHLFTNGTLDKEGYYKNSFKQNWWVFHNQNGYRTIKKQYVHGKISGYALYYRKSNLSKVEEYKSNEKLGEWTSYWKFRADHPDFSMKDLKK